MRPVRGRAQPAGERTTHLGRTSVGKRPQCTRLWGDAEQGNEGTGEARPPTCFSFGMWSRHQGKKLPAQGPVASFSLVWTTGGTNADDYGRGRALNISVLHPTMERQLRRGKPQHNHPSFFHLPLKKLRKDTYSFKSILIPHTALHFRRMSKKRK